MSNTIRLLTFEEVADFCHLIGTQRTRFLKYMRIRWPDMEDDFKRGQHVDYALGWGDRFYKREEYARSDGEGRRVLEEEFGYTYAEEFGRYNDRHDELRRY